MTDNGSCYRSKAFPQRLPRPRPQAHPHQAITEANGNAAERFIQTALREWAYAEPTRNSDRRAEELPDLAAPIQL